MIQLERFLKRNLFQFLNQELENCFWTIQHISRFKRGMQSPWKHDQLNSRTHISWKFQQLTRGRKFQQLTRGRHRPRRFDQPFLAWIGLEGQHCWHYAGLSCIESSEFRIVRAAQRGRILRQHPTTEFVQQSADLQLDHLRRWYVWNN